MLSSLSTSILEVASSKIIIGLLAKITLANANLCFCPPDNALPAWPTSVNNPSLNPLTKSYNLAIFNEKREKELDVDEKTSS